MFTIKDFKNMDCVHLRNGTDLMYVDKHFINHSYDLPLDYFSDTLECYEDRMYDVMTVKRLPSGKEDIYSIINITLHGQLLFDRNVNFIPTWNGLTMKEAHRKMWNDLADGKVETKIEWFNEWETKVEAPENLCFACEEAKHRSINNNFCLSCPIGEYTNESGCLDGLYIKWHFAKGFEKFKFAHDIANLEWKEE
jgi:hypothetical protein|nr:MAG TPA: hypothetical protein [Caudoviricetes sp.]